MQKNKRLMVVMGRVSPRPLGSIVRLSSLFVSQIALCAAVFLSVSPAVAGTVTIFVDGIGAAATLPGPQLAGPLPDRTENYLQSSALGRALRAGIPGRQRTIPWNGRLSDANNLRKAIADLQIAVLDAARRGDRINLVTHSMGSVVAHAALKNLAATTDRTTSAYHGIDHFVTLGSPLGSNGALLMIRRFLYSPTERADQTIDVPESTGKVHSAGQLRVGLWTNVWFVTDEIGAQSISNRGVVNKRFDRRSPTTSHHSLPYTDPASIAYVVAVLSTSFSLAGEWSATGYVCGARPTGEQRVTISDVSGLLVATKRQGDACIPGGEVTFFSRRHSAEAFPVPEVVVLRETTQPGSTVRLQPPAELLRVNANEFILLHRKSLVVFRRIIPYGPDS